MLVILLAWSFVSGNVNISFSADGCRIETPILSESFRYEDISDINLATGMDFTRNGFAFPFLGIYCGSYKNKELGEFQAFAYKKNPCYVVIHLDDGNTIVINQLESNTTNDIYLALSHTLSEISD